MEKVQYKIERISTGMRNLEYKFYIYKKVWYGWKELDYYFNYSSAREAINRDIGGIKPGKTYYYNQKGDLIAND